MANAKKKKAKQTTTMLAILTISDLTMTTSTPSVSDLAKLFKIFANIAFPVDDDDSLPVLESEPEITALLAEMNEFVEKKISYSKKKRLHFALFLTQWQVDLIISNLSQKFPNAIFMVSPAPNTKLRTSGHMVFGVVGTWQ